MGAAPGRKGHRDQSEIYHSARRQPHRLCCRNVQRVYTVRSGGAPRGRRHEDDSAASHRIHQPDAWRSSHVRKQMKPTLLAGAFAIAVTAVFDVWPRAQQQPPAPPPPQQPSEIGATISSDGTGPPRLAVPDFIALSPDAETAAIAKTIGQVLWDDLNYEHEFAFIPRDVYSTIPRATSFNDVPFDRWRELNADGLIVGTVQKTTSGVQVEM